MLGSLSRFLKRFQILEWAKKRGKGDPENGHSPIRIHAVRLFVHKICFGLSKFRLSN